ncbi:UDP-glucose 6-dehydrogenase, partial [Verrucosispora sp. FIM060022]
MTIPYPNTQPMPVIAAVTPPSGASRPRVTFLGTGYLGATYAICYAELGYEVLGYDVDPDKIAKLNAGEVPIHEPGLDELLRRNLAAGRLRFSTDIAETADFGDVHFICV